MTPPPASPKIYHITHVENLPAIIGAGGLVSDAAMIAQGGGHSIIGMSSIKQRRLTLPVRCHEGTFVGEYVPFYFCPRSIMLYVIHRANHASLEYRGGQGPVLHLEADLHDVVAWADERDRRWAFSLSNAGAYYAECRCNVAELNQINWPAVANPDFRSQEVSEAKQAELLMHEEFPWSLISRIGVINADMKPKAEAALAAADHKPAVEIQRSWYY